MKIICIGRNYAAHAEELNHQIRGGAEDPAERSRQAGGGADTLPERNRPGSGECSPEPIWFLKPDTALLRNNDPFYIPAFSHEVHYECELVVRIDRVGKSIAERFAHRYYKEVGLGIDFTARDLQPKVCRGSAARRSTAQRRFRRNSYLCRSWTATCRSCASRWR